MTINLKVLNQKQLGDLIERAEQRKREVEKERLGNARKKIELLLESEGLTFEDVFSTPHSPHRSAVRSSRKGSHPRRI